MIDVLLKVLQAIAGVLLIFFIPGYIIERHYIKSRTLLEKISLTVTLSLAITIVIGFILGLLHIFNYWTSLICFMIIIAFLSVMIYVDARSKKEK